MRWLSCLSLSFVMMLGLVACGSSDAATSTTSTSSSGSGAGGSGGSGAGGMAGCSMPTPVQCSDQVVLELNLQKTVAKETITNQPDGAGYTTMIDATAGGAFAPNPDAYNYGKFTDSGLQKVMISDEDALGSLDWDIAFRRYVIRVNSGYSGPSCVMASRTPMTDTYDTLTTLPDNLDYKSDDYFTDDCHLIPDGSGLMSSPATAMSGYYKYSTCLEMSGNVYVLELADGKHVKLVVDDYYTPSVQDECNTMHMIPMSNTGSGNIVVRWAYLQ